MSQVENFGKTQNPAFNPQLSNVIPTSRVTVVGEAAGSTMSSVQYRQAHRFPEAQSSFNLAIVSSQDLLWKIVGQHSNQNYSEGRIGMLFSFLCGSNLRSHVS